MEELGHFITLTFALMFFGDFLFCGHKFLTTDNKLWLLVTFFCLTATSMFIHMYVDGMIRTHAQQINHQRVSVSQKSNN